MMTPIIALCPGQGAQTVGMGRGWYDASPAAHAIFDEADALLKGRFEQPLSELCFTGPAEVLNRTDVAQPALYTVGVACWTALFQGPDRPPLQAAAGLSLGEYTALHLAGSLSFADGLELVALRGQAMQEAAQTSGGSMIALVGADAQQAAQVCREAAGDDVLVTANFNAPGQIVLSGSSTACQRAQEVANGVGLRAAPLAVAGAFHSPLMAPAADRLAQALARVEIAPPRCPVVSNVTARPHQDDPESIQRLLVQQLTSPVQWSDSCAWLVANMTAALHELAPGRVLAGLMRRIDRQTKVISHDQPDK